MKTIVLTNDRLAGSELQNLLKAIEPKLQDLELFDRKTLIQRTRSFANVECIFSTWGMPPLTSFEIQDYFPALHHLLYAGGDTTYFDAPFAEAGVSVVSCKHLNAIPVAEYVVANALLANKGVLRSQVAYKRPLWWISFNKARALCDAKAGNYRAKVGLLGCGNVGQKVLELLTPYDVEVLVHDVKPNVLDAHSQNFSESSREEIFETCDVVVNLLPSNSETRQSIDEQLLTSMKGEATFINVGRGDTVVERDLIKVLKVRTDLTAVLDVSHREPVLPWSRLLRLPNAFLTPHIAGSRSREVERMARYLITVYQQVI